MNIEKGDTIEDLWGHIHIIIDNDCGSNMCGKLYEHENGKYIVEGNIKKVIKK